MPVEGFGDADLMPRLPRIGPASLPNQELCAGSGLASAQQADAIRDQIAPRGVRPIPFEHRKFGVVGGAALAIAKHMGELPDARQPGR